MTLHLGWLGTYVHTSHDDRDDVVGRGEIDIEHDQTLAITEARLGLDVGLPRGFGATLVVPVRIVSTTIRYLDTDGAEVSLVDPGIHHRNETLTGLADPMVLGSFGRSSGAWHGSVRAGASLPLGRTEDDPFTRGDVGLPHQHLQMGTGTANPVLAVEGSRAWDAWRVSAFAFTQQVLYTNDCGYRAGDRYAGGVTLHRRAGARWRLRAGTELLAETAERWDGATHTDDGNRGRVDWMLSGGAAWSVAPGWSLDLGVKVPLVTHAVGGQLDMPAIVEVGASWSFGGGPTARPDLPAPDAAAELTPVPGKITIVDYWASWCEACETLEPALVDLARARPDRIALRRVDVSRWTDIPFAMPHVTIFDATGARVFDRSSDTDLDAFVAAIHAAVEPTRTRAHILVTERGFEPDQITVPAGVPVVLTFERKTARTCATEVVMTVDGQRIERPLPLDQPVELTLTFPAPGTITYACGMDMIRGSITVEP